MGSRDLNLDSLALELVLLTTTLSSTFLGVSRQELLLFSLLKYHLLVAEKCTLLLEPVCLPPVLAQEGAIPLQLSVSPCSCVAPTRSKRPESACFWSQLCSPDGFVCWSSLVARTVCLDLALLWQHILSVKFEACKDLRRIWSAFAPQKMGTKMGV